jgi:enoyl-CoA hydratase
MTDSRCRVISVSGGLLDALARVRQDDGARAVILSEFAGGEAATPSADLVRLIEDLGKPVIAAVNGAATGAGCLLALACSFAVAAGAASFALPPDYADRDFALSFVRQVAGRSQQDDPLLRKLADGEAVTADEAFRLGLVTQVVADAELLEVCGGLARQIGGHAPLALAFAVEAVSEGLRLPLAEALRRESELFSRCFSTADAREGVRAFYEKRPPRFTGR